MSIITKMRLNTFTASEDISFQAAKFLTCTIFLPTWRFFCLTLKIKGYRCYEVKLQKSKKLAVTGNQTQDTWLGLQSTPNRRHILSIAARCETDVQYILRIVRASGCPVVVAQWQSTGCTSQESWVQFPATVSFLLSTISLLLFPTQLTTFTAHTHHNIYTYNY